MEGVVEGVVEEGVVEGVVGVGGVVVHMAIDRKKEAKKPWGKDSANN